MANIVFNDDKEADLKYKQYKSKDPFPEIKPALLNSADIHEYISTTGMICPYSSAQRKSASYEILFLETEIIRWDKNEKKITEEFKGDDDSFKLEKNEIIYIRLKTSFRIPDYIALRFNLRINLVHKGLLLGTGPLVDPGFEGNILIPVHNLTANDYILKANDGFIWVEFTKISEHIKWYKDARQSAEVDYVPFPSDKTWLKAEDYFKAANDNNPIRSSIPEEVEKAIKVAEGAMETANFYKKVSWGLIITIIISFAVAFFGAIWPITDLVQQSTQRVQDSIIYVQESRESNHKEIESLRLKTEILENKMNKIEKEIVIDNKSINSERQVSPPKKESINSKKH